MKSVLIIGLGRFGHHLCIDMANRGNEVMIIDKDEKKDTGFVGIRNSSTGRGLYK